MLLKEVAEAASQVIARLLEKARHTTEIMLVSGRRSALKLI
jgi:hypothetical protein